MAELTEQEARIELGKLELPDLIALAEKNDLPFAGKSKEELIEVLLGKCGGCQKQKGTMTVVIISKRGTASIQKSKTGGAPCVGCGK